MRRVRSQKRGQQKDFKTIFVISSLEMKEVICAKPKSERGEE
jgi:hypothetical protein